MTKSRKNKRTYKRKHSNKSHKQKGCGGISKVNKVIKTVGKSFLKQFLFMLFLTSIYHGATVIMFSNTCKNFIKSNGETIRDDNKLPGSKNCNSDNAEEAYANQCKFIEIIKLINDNLILKLAVCFFLVIDKRNDMTGIYKYADNQAPQNFTYNYAKSDLEVDDVRNDYNAYNEVFNKTLNNVYNINNNYYYLLRVIDITDNVIRRVFKPNASYIKSNFANLFPSISSINRVIDKYEEIQHKYNSNASTKNTQALTTYRTLT